MEEKAKDCADLMCTRLTDIYGGPATLQSLQGTQTLEYEARISCEWGDPPKFVHRVACIRLHANGEVRDIEVKDL